MFLEGATKQKKKSLKASKPVVGKIIAPKMVQVNQIFRVTVKAKSKNLLTRVIIKFEGKIKKIPIKKKKRAVVKASFTSKIPGKKIIRVQAVDKWGKSPWKTRQITVKKKRVSLNVNILNFPKKIQGGKEIQVLVTVNIPQTKVIPFELRSNPRRILSGAWKFPPKAKRHRFKLSIPKVKRNKKVDLLLSAKGWNSNRVSFIILARKKSTGGTPQPARKQITILPVPSEVVSGEAMNISIRLNTEPIESISFQRVTNPPSGRSTWHMMAGQTENTYSQRFSSETTQRYSLTLEREGWSCNTVQFTVHPRRYVTLLQVPRQIRPGDSFELRVRLSHPDNDPSSGFRIITRPSIISDILRFSPNQTDKRFTINIPGSAPLGSLVFYLEKEMWHCNATTIPIVNQLDPNLMPDENAPPNQITIQPVPDEIVSGNYMNVTIRLSTEPIENITFRRVTDPPSGLSTWHMMAGQTENTYRQTFTSEATQRFALTLERDGWTCNTVHFTVHPRRFVTLLQVPRQIRPGDSFELRVRLSHPDNDPPSGFRIITRPPIISNILQFSPGQMDKTFPINIPGDAPLGSLVFYLEKELWHCNANTIPIVSELDPNMMPDENAPPNHITIQPVPDEIVSGEYMNITIRLSTEPIQNISFRRVTDPPSGLSTWHMMAGHTENTYRQTFMSEETRRFSLTLEREGWTCNTVHFTVHPYRYVTLLQVPDEIRAGESFQLRVRLSHPDNDPPSGFRVITQPNILTQTLYFAAGETDKLFTITIPENTPPGNIVFLLEKDLWHCNANSIQILE